MEGICYTVTAYTISESTGEIAAFEGNTFQMPLDSGQISEMQDLALRLHRGQSGLDDIRLMTREEIVEFLHDQDDGKIVEEKDIPSLCGMSIN